MSEQNHDQDVMIRKGIDTAALRALARSAHEEGWFVTGEVTDPIFALCDEVDRLRAERDLLAQAMWDGWAALGFDTDGDNGPRAQIAGARSYETWAQQWLRDVREHRKDDDEALDESIQADHDLREARTALDRVRALLRQADWGDGSHPPAVYRETLRRAIDGPTLATPAPVDAEDGGR